MARLGVDSNNVSDVVSQALQNQFTAREMKQLRSNFKSQSHEMSPNQLANQFAQKIGNTGKNNSGSGNTSGDSGGSESGSDNAGSGGSDGMGGSGNGGSSGGGANGSGGGKGKK